VSQVEAQLERARVLHSGGVLEKVDVMRLEAALAGARQQSIEATSQRTIAHQALLMTLGLPEDAAIEAVTELPAEPAAPPLSPSDAADAAVRARPALDARNHRARQARDGAAAAKAAMLPSIVGLATIQHNTGAGTFQPETAWFVGASLKWNVWEWGKSWKSYQAAQTRASQASLAAQRYVDVIRLQARTAAIQAQAAFEGIDVARARLDAAEEAFRIQKVRFDEGAANTTDLLDAETEVAQARLADASARYSYFLSLSTLARKTGELPTALLPNL
jgi:outer membrane protein TolC